MSDIIIRAENLSKRYLLRHQSGGAGYQRFSESLTYWAKAPLRKLASLLTPRPSPPPKNSGL